MGRGTVTATFLLIGIAAGADAAEPCIAIPVYQVDVVECTRAADGIIVHARGLARTAGWTAARLQPTGPAGTFELRACPPTRVAAQALWPVEARTQAPAAVNAVTVTAERNSRGASCRAQHAAEEANGKNAEEMRLLIGGPQ
jgi:hypothetical protein